MMSETLQYVIVYAALAVCLAVTARYYLRRWRKKGKKCDSCATGCEGCALHKSCGKKELMDRGRTAGKPPKAE